MNDYQAKLEELRKKWKKYPENRDLIQRQATSLKYYYEGIPNKQKKEPVQSISAMIKELT